MTIASTRLTPDIQFYFENFVRTSTLNNIITPFSCTLSSTYLLENKSFIRLLFDDSWDILNTNYTYLFEEITNKLSIPYDFRTRLMIYPVSGKYYQSVESDGINLFNLESDDILLLNKLLEYRLDSTSINIIDIDYSSLSTNLSKLIFLYLDLKINNNYEIFDDVTPIASSINLLENCFEMYICENLFLYISEKEL